MAATLWNPYPAPVFSQTGEVAAGAKALFYRAGTANPLVTYLDSALTTPATFPVVANVAGVFPPVFLPYVDYRVRVIDANDVLIYDADGISNPTPSDAGGGGGIVVTASQIFQTGDTKWSLRSGPMDGFVRMNARTIGSDISGATERANADTADLFSFLWALPNTVAPVSGGRGASAAADWSANKAISIPTMQGLATVGVDDMGGVAAQNIQIITTAAVTNSSATCVVASASGLARGMNVIIAGAAAGKIVTISGTTVTLSAPYTGTTDASASFRASFLSDAQQIGAIGGVQTVIQDSSEMPSHTHGVTDPGHKHKIGQKISVYAAGFGLINNPTGTKDEDTSTVTTGITINNTGGGAAMQNVQPSRAVTYYMKL